MNNIRHIVNVIGRASLCEELDCGSTAITNAITRGAFPAGWYPVIRKLSEKAGIDLPDNLFNWRLPKD